MKYIIEGENSVLDNVLREQRIRIARGQVKVLPASDSSSEELESLQVEIQNLKEEMKSKDARIAELEAAIQNDAVTDTKEAIEGDTKEAVVADTKEMIEADSKEVEAIEEKKPRKKSKE